MLQVKAYEAMTTVVNTVGCSNEIKQDALYYMESAYSELGGSGRMPLDRMAAACLFLALKMHKLRVSSIEVATHVGKHKLGADCKAVLRALGIGVPPVDFISYVQHCLNHLPALCNSRAKVRKKDCQHGRHPSARSSKCLGAACKHYLDLAGSCGAIVCRAHGMVADLF